MVNTNVDWTYTGMGQFRRAEKDEILTFLKTIKVPNCKDCSSEFGFGIQLDGNITYCEVIAKHNIYDIWFDSAKVAKLNQDEQHNWVHVLGKSIPASALKEISGRIEDHYC